MNREIKFRVWEKNHKKWIDDFAMFLTTGELLKYDRKAGGEYETVMRTEEAMKELLDYDYKSIEVMQYTGLKDKFGMEIYEGDIIKHGENKKNLYVTMHNGCWTLESKFLRYYVINMDIQNSHINSCEVIGNIYENPELLKQQEVKND